MCCLLVLYTALCVGIEMQHIFESYCFSFEDITNRFFFFPVFLLLILRYYFFLRRHTEVFIDFISVLFGTFANWIELMPYEINRVYS